MHRHLIGLARSLGRFARAEDGSATIEFIILVPLALTVCLAGIEMGLVMTRQMMLDRSLDVVVRDIRLGGFANVIDDPNTSANELHDVISEAVCENAMIPNCEDNLRLEMAITPIRGWAGIDPTPDCRDRAQPGRPVRGMTLGSQNQLMILRACALYDPMFATNVMGRALVVNGRTYYKLLSSSSFVIEPRGSRS